MIVPYPNLWPNRCLNCSSNQGPVWFGGTHGTTEEAIYLCRTCAETIGVEFGFVEGDEMMKLREAATEIEQMRLEKDALHKQLVDKERDLEEYHRQSVAAQADAEQARAELATMQHHVKDVRDVAEQLSTIGAANVAAGKPPLDDVQKFMNGED